LGETTDDLKSQDMKFTVKILFPKKFISAVGSFVLIGLFFFPAIASDRFLSKGDGTVTDARTGLMWAEVDNGNPISWPNALSYCQNYKGGGYTDWRMPTLAELASLYNIKFLNKYGYHVPSLITTTAQSIWAAETRAFEAARFNFAYGQLYWIRQSYSGPTRALPVRSGNY
jgi:hypothetical protein